MEVVSVRRQGEKELRRVKDEFKKDVEIIDMEVAKCK